MGFCPTELRDRYHESRVIPFIGAGVSMSVEWEDPTGNTTRGPSWSELVEKATKLLGFQNPELARVRGTDLQILEYFKLKHSEQTAKLMNWLSGLMNPPDDALTKSPMHLELISLEKCRLFYTTNFDNFLERSFILGKRDHTVVAVESQMGGSQADCEIMKFHGDLDHPDQIVLTESDYENRLSMSTSMDYRLRADLLGRVLLFLGYSFRDPNVSYLFRLFTDEFRDKQGGLHGTRAYIAVPDPSDFEIQLFAARHIKVIPISSVRMTEDTVALLKEMRS